MSNKVEATYHGARTGRIERVLEEQFPGRGYTAEDASITYTSHPTATGRCTGRHCSEHPRPVCEEDDCDNLVGTESRFFCNPCQSGRVRVIEDLLR